MATPVISISADSSEESVRSSISLIILLDSDTKTKTGIIPADIHSIIPIVPPVTPEVEAVVVVSPAGVLELVIHLDTETDPSEDPPSPKHALFAPGISPLYDSEPEYESEPLEFPSEEDAQEPHKASVAQWRAAVMAHSSSSSSSASTPPSSFHIIPTPYALPTLPIETTITPSDVPISPVRATTILVTDTTLTPYLIGGCNRVTARKRFRHPPTVRLAPLVPSSHPLGSLPYSSNTSGSSTKRSSYSSSDTAYTPLGPLTHRRPQCSDYVSPLPSSSDMPSRKRRRMLRGSPSAYHHEVSIEDNTKMGCEDSIETRAKGDTERDIEKGTEADAQTNTKADAEADVQASVETDIGAEAKGSVGTTIEVGVDFVVEPIAPHDLPTLTVAERLDEYEETIQGMYEHLLEMSTQRLEDIEEEESPVQYDLMLVELGGFDVIIGMDWLSKYHAVIICNEKVVRTPYRNDELMIQGDEHEDRRNSRLSIILCTKTQKYIQKGFHVFLAQVTEKKAEDKSDEKRLEDVPVI
ncbi:putative reverse transcriptase domain-containing protein [Tanacetum coccineum]